jgi:N-acetyltransferase
MDGIETKSVWPTADREGRPVDFTSREARPRPDEFRPLLEGESVRLEPMREDHVDALCEIGLDPDITRLMPNRLFTREDMAGYIRDALAARQALSAIPFVTVLTADRLVSRVVGTTRFLNIDSRNRRMEIGATWIGKQWQRTWVNTEAKYLMLRHAFETLECVRVELKTDSLNARSRQAILRIGAVEEGVLRNHVITSDGRIRHTVVFSITASEWPEVRRRLEGLLGEGSMSGKRTTG